MFSYRIATAESTAALDMIHEDLVHPPLYYLLLKVFTAFTGITPLGIRALSLAAGLGTITLVAYMGSVVRELRPVALLAAALLSLNAWHIFYSQQARSYALYTFLVTVLLLWCWRVERFERSVSFWAAGSIVMAFIVYTHYVGAVYVACVILGVTFSGVSRRAKVYSWIAAVIAAASFVPWLVSEYALYIARKGLGINLGWQQLPSFYDLRYTYANYLGVPHFPGTTTLVLLLGCVLVFCACAFGKISTPARRAVLSSLVFTALLPPILLFVVTMKPLSQPVFNLRHVLPSVVSWVLLVSYGVWAIASNTSCRRLVLIGGSALLVGLQLSATIHNLFTLPLRLPFAQVAQELPIHTPVYTSGAYGVGASVNFYLAGRRTVKALPESPDTLPDTFVLLYRPNADLEKVPVERLITSGWSVVGQADYSNGGGWYCVRAVRLQRPRSELTGR